MKASPKVLANVAAHGLGEWSGLRAAQGSSVQPRAAQGKRTAAQGSNVAATCGESGRPLVTVLPKVLARVWTLSGDLISSR